jgi:REP element-mobilizing transposase RayT
VLFRPVASNRNLHERPFVASFENLNEMNFTFYPQMWAVGYYMGSVGDGVTMELIKEYIENQKSAENSGQEADSNCIQPRLFD